MRKISTLKNDNDPRLEFHGRLLSVVPDCTERASHPRPVTLFSYVHFNSPSPAHHGVIRQTVDVSTRARSRAFIAPSPALFDALVVKRRLPSVFLLATSFYIFKQKLKNGREIMEFTQSLFQPSNGSRPTRAAPLSYLLVHTSPHVNA
jgi:hypothetical protein